MIAIGVQARWLLPALSVLGLNLFGDAVRDAMDPRLRTSLDVTYRQ